MNKILSYFSAAMFLGCMGALAWVGYKGNPLTDHLGLAIGCGLFLLASVVAHDHSQK